jgi:hypothetical protein
MSFNGIPVRGQVLDGNGDPVSGALVDFFKTDTTTRQDAFADPSLETPVPNPFIADASGQWLAYLSPSLAYYVRPKSADGATPYNPFYVGKTDNNPDDVWHLPTRAAMTAASSAFLSDDMLVMCAGKDSAGDGEARLYRAVEGTGLTANGDTILDHDTLDYQFEAVGQDLASAQLSGTIRITAAATTLSADHTETRAMGEISGDQSARTQVVTATVPASGTNIARNMTKRITVTGSNDPYQVNAENLQVELQSEGAGYTFALASQGYIRTGLAGVGGVDVTTARVYEGHIANEGTGLIVNAVVFNASDIDLIDGTGNVTNSVGFQSANLGHATRVTDKALGFHATNMTAGAGQTTSFLSEQSHGTDVYAFRSTSSAKSAFAGGLRLGDSSQNGDLFELVGGYAKISRGTSFSGSGSYHEIMSNQADFIARLTNEHASAPHGLDVHFSGANPNNNTQIFMRCRDSGTRYIVYSDGDVVNQDNSYGAISDLKFKQDVNPARSQIDDFRKLKFRNYRMKNDVAEFGDDAKEQLGVIAQEAQEVCPGLVKEAADFKEEQILDEDGNPVLDERGSPMFRTVQDGSHLEFRYSVLALKACAAVQEIIQALDAVGVPLGPQGPNEGAPNLKDILKDLEDAKSSIDERKPEPVQEGPPADIAELFDPNLTPRQNQEALQKKYAALMSERELELTAGNGSKAMELLKRAERFESGITWNRARLAEVI